MMFHKHQRWEKSVAAATSAEGKIEKEIEMKTIF